LPEEAGAVRVPGGAGRGSCLPEGSAGGQAGGCPLALPWQASLQDEAGGGGAGAVTGRAALGGYRKRSGASAAAIAGGRSWAVPATRAASSAEAAGAVWKP
jgi:hypothetical protein